MPDMSDVNMLLDDPELKRRGPGEEFALAYARRGPAAAVELRAAISDLFPPARRRPRYTVRHLLRRAVVDSDEVTVFRERAGDSAGPAPERDFAVSAVAVPVRTIRAVAPVPPRILADPAALAAFVDFRLLVRLGTVENDVLLNGAEPGGVQGLLRAPGLRRQEAAGDPADTLLAGAARCERHGGSADGVVLHPDDWWPLAGNGLLDRLAAQGVRAGRTRMIPAGMVLIGDFTAGATLLDRRSSTIRLADGELVAEIREGLAVHLPGHFVLAALHEDAGRDAHD